MVNNLQATINGSPVLAQQIKQAATTADPNDQINRPPRALLEKFGFVPSGQSMGGSYNANTKTLNLPEQQLQTPPQGKYNADNLTFVFGHEVQHSLYSPVTYQASKTFRSEVNEIAASTPLVHDYTEPAQRYNLAAREDEARAEIGGWNALNSRQKQINPQADLSTMLAAGGGARTDDFVYKDQHGNTVARAGLTFNADGTLTATPGNVEAMGKHYFDRPAPEYDSTGTTLLNASQRPVKLGHSTDYTNYYGQWAVNTITRAERQNAQQHPGETHQLTLDMDRLGYKEKLLEQQGIDLYMNQNVRQPYYDSSNMPQLLGTPPVRYFDHTIDSSVNPQNTYVPTVPGPGSSSGPGSSTPSAPQGLGQRNSAPAGSALDALANFAQAIRKGDLQDREPAEAALCNASGVKEAVKNATDQYKPVQDERAQWREDPSQGINR
jgi:uncharacterized lipoprotein NlpE involved in copper resistance